MQMSAYSVQCVVCSVQCAVCIVQCAVYSVQCTVCSVQCTVYSRPTQHSTLHVSLQAAAERGDTEVTMTPEHGPPNYQVGEGVDGHLLTYTDISDIY